MGLDEKDSKTTTTTNPQNKTKSNQCIENTIYHEQIGLTPKTQGWFSVCKSIKVIHYISRMKDRNHRIDSVNV